MEIHHKWKSSLASELVEQGEDSVVLVESKRLLVMTCYHTGRDFLASVGEMEGL